MAFQATITHVIRLRTADVTNSEVGTTFSNLLWQYMKNTC